MRHQLRVTRGKVPIKHSSSLQDGDIGPGTVTTFPHLIYVTDAGDRTVTGAQVDIKEHATTGNLVNVGDIIKYVNICVQCSPTGADPAVPNDNNGWLEWAVVWQRERTSAIANTNLGVATLGSVCVAAYRENCLMTGCFPIGAKQSMSADIKIKLPQRCCRVKLGDRLTLFCYVRTSKVTDTRTDSHMIIASSIFKSYS